MAIQINGKKVIHLGSMTIPVLKGEKGDKGDRGQQGIPGIDGKDGQTPLRGIDYWTTEDKTEIINEIDNKVQEDLKSYYLKSETYNKEEIDNKISLIPKFNIKVVDKLPTSNISEATVYLVKSGEESQNLYTEYIYTNGVWEQLGTQKLDLSGFYNKDEINSMLATRDSKITALEEENRSQADRIKELEEEVESLEADYKPNEISGETVVISDGRPKSKISVIGNGNSYQETTEGYNRLEPLESKTSGYFSFDKDTSILTLNGTLDANGYAGLTNVIGAFPSGEYTIVVEYISGSIQNSSVVNIGIGSQEWTTGGVNISGLNSSNSKIVKKVTLGDTNNNLYSQCGIGIYNNFKARLWVASGTYTLSTIPPYEPYTNGASPNTEYEQDIEVIDGVNRLNVHDLSEKAKAVGITVDEDDYISNSSSDGRSWAYENSNWFKKLKAGTYTIYVFVKNKPTSINSLMHIYKNGENTSIGYISYTSLQSDVAKVTITLSEDAEIGIMLKIFDGVFRVMLVDGTQDLPYLPYGHIGLSHLGENISEQLTPDRYDISGVNFKTTQKDVTLNGTSISNVYQILYRKILPKGKYLCRGCSKGGSLTTYRLVFSIDGTNNNDIGNGIEIELTEEKTVEVGIWFANNQILNNLVFTPQIYADYELIPIDLAGNSIAGIKNTDIKDNLLIGIDGSCEINENIFIEKITGSNITGKSAYGVNTYNIKPSKSVIPALANASKILCLSNYFKGISYNERTNGIKDSIYAETENNLIVRDTSFTTVEELKTFLDNNEVYIMYVLNTPETIDLPSIEPITLFEGTNIFELVTNLGTTLAVTYKVSNKKKILNLEERISALESAVIGG